jgi:peptide-methionine (R)-S-oxide reductase
MMTNVWARIGVCALLGAGCNSSVHGEERKVTVATRPHHHYKVEKSDDEWRKILTAEQFHVLREQGTERAFSGAYYASHDRATYVCAACGQELFKSDQKFDSGTGWPSFWAPADKGAVETASDESFGMARTEVRCARCGGHLGHVFNDGPRPTGLRYCINSAALKQVK